MNSNRGLKDLSAVVVMLLCATGCGSAEPYEVWADAVTVVGGKKVAGEMPAASGSGPSTTGVPSAINALPGQTFTLTIPYSGGAVDKVFVDFLGDGYWEVAVNASASSGQITVPVLVSSSLDLEEAYGLLARYALHGTNGGVSSAGSTQVWACTQSGTCTPGVKDPDNSDSTQCNDLAGTCSTGGTLRSCVDSKGPTCWYELRGTRYACAANCDCSAAAERAANACEP
jgi:hypothetical protein